MFYYSKWMEQTPELQTKQLGQICFPATHDSGAYSLSDLIQPFSPSTFIGSEVILSALLSAISPLAGATGVIDTIATKAIRDISLTTSKSVLEQLNAGIRCLDLRIYQNTSGSFSVYHGSGVLGMLGVPLSSVLGDIQTFLSTSNGEIVYITFGHYDSSTGVTFSPATFATQVTNALGNWAFAPGSSTEATLFANTYTTVIGYSNSTVAAGSKVILVDGGGIVPAQFAQFWGSAYSPPDNAAIATTLAGLYTDTTSVTTMWSTQLTQFNANAGLTTPLPFALYATCTPQVKDVIAIVVRYLSGILFPMAAGLVASVVFAPVGAAIISAMAALDGVYLSNKDWFDLEDLAGQVAAPAWQEIALFQKPTIQANNAITFIYCDYFENTNLVDLAIAYSRLSALPKGCNELGIVQYHGTGTDDFFYWPSAGQTPSDAGALTQEGIAFFGCVVQDTVTISSEVYAWTFGTNPVHAALGTVAPSITLPSGNTYTQSTQPICYGYPATAPGTGAVPVFQYTKTGSDGLPRFFYTVMGVTGQAGAKDQFGPDTSWIKNPATTPAFYGQPSEVPETVVVYSNSKYCVTVSSLAGAAVNSSNTQSISVGTPSDQVGAGNGVSSAWLNGQIYVAYGCASGQNNIDGVSVLSFPTSSLGNGATILTTTNFWLTSLGTNITAQGAPSIAIYKGQIWIGYTQPNTNRVYVLSANPGSGSALINSPVQNSQVIAVSGCGPAIAWFQDRLYVCWADKGSNNPIYVASSIDGVIFDRMLVVSPNRDPNPPKSYSENNEPSMTVFQGNLYVLWGTPLTMAITADGLSFSAVPIVVNGNSVGCTNGVEISSFGAALFSVAYYGMYIVYNYNNNLYVLLTSDGVNFTTASSTVQTNSYRPSFAGFLNA